MATRWLVGGPAVPPSAAMKYHQSPTLRIFGPSIASPSVSQPSGISQPSQTFSRVPGMVSMPSSVSLMRWPPLRKSHFCPSSPTAGQGSIWPTCRSTGSLQGPYGVSAVTTQLLRLWTVK